MSKDKKLTPTSSPKLPTQIMGVNPKGQVPRMENPPPPPPQKPS